MLQFISILTVKASLTLKVISHFACYGLFILLILQVLTGQMSFAEGNSQIPAALNPILGNEESEGEDDSDEGSGDDPVPPLPNFLSQEWFGLDSNERIVNHFPQLVQDFHFGHLTETTFREIFGLAVRAADVRNYNGVQGVLISPSNQVIVAGRTVAQELEQLTVLLEGIVTNNLNNPGVYLISWVNTCVSLNQLFYRACRGTIIPEGLLADFPAWFRNMCLFQSVGGVIYDPPQPWFINELVRQVQENLPGNPRYSDLNDAQLASIRHHLETYTQINGIDLLGLNPDTLSLLPLLP